MSTNKLNISTDLLNVSLCYIKDIKFLLFFIKRSSIYYKKVPSDAYLLKDEQTFLTLKSSWKFINNISKEVTDLILRARGFLVLKGLGLKSKLNNKILELKLGFSHKCNIAIDEEIRVRIKKNLIFLQSIDKEKLGNFLYKIKSLKLPDIYKGKGIWYKDEKIELKIIKKK